MIKGTTKKSQKHIDTEKFVTAFVKNHNRQPTLTEIGNYFGIKTTAVWNRLRLIKRNEKKCPWCNHEFK